MKHITAVKYRTNDTVLPRIAIVIPGKMSIATSAKIVKKIVLPMYLVPYRQMYEKKRICDSSFLIKS